MQLAPKAQEHERAAGRRPGGAIALVAALLAVLLQAFAVQTHIHAYGASGGGYAVSDDRSQAPDAARATAADHQMSCVFCEVLASSGRVTLPSAPDLVAMRQAVDTAAALAIAAAPRAASHAWRSRAPPFVP